MELVAQYCCLWISSTMILLCMLIRARGRSSPHGRLPPGPRPLPIIGSLFMLGNNPHRSLARLAKTYGPLMALKLGQVITVVVSSPDMAREVLQKKDQAFCGRSVPDAIRILGHHQASLIWLPADRQWRDLRRICSTRLFMFQRLNDTRGLRCQKVRELITYVRSRCLAGEPVDIGQAAFTTVLNLISNTLFSVDMAAPDSESAPNFRDIVRALMDEAGAPNLSDFFPMLAVMDLQRTRRRMTCHLKKLYDIFDELIEQRMQAKTEKESTATTTNDFLDSLIQLHTHDEELKLNRRAMKPLFADLFIAGTDTLSITVEWAMAELLRNPSSMARARSEVIAAIGTEKEVDESDIERLPYLQAVIKETLRLHPPGPFLAPHKAETSVEICGYTVPEGARVLVNVWAMGRDVDVWTEPDLFKPERFVGSNIDYKGQDFELIPFGAGRRICPGLPLAFRSVHLMLASMLHSFNWKLPDGMGPMDVDMVEQFGIALAKAVPLRAVPFLDSC